MRTSKLQVVSVNKLHLRSATEYEIKDSEGIVPLKYEKHVPVQLSTPSKHFQVLGGSLSTPSEPPKNTTLQKSKTQHFSILPKQVLELIQNPTTGPFNKIPSNPSNNQVKHLNALTVKYSCFKEATKTATTTTATSNTP